MCFGEMRPSNPILSQVKATISGFLRWKVKIKLLGYRLMFVKKQEKKHQNVSSVHTVTVPHTTL